MPRQPQLDLLSPEEIWQRSLLAKVEGLIPWQVYDHLSRCGRDEMYRTCKGCGDWSTFYYRCSLKFCPLCNWRIARNRAEVLKFWSVTISQPKHVVLTMRNFPTLTRSRIRSVGKAFAKLRRNRIWKDVKGGCVSTEITNEGRGWHLHLHIMVDARWIDAAQLAIVWGQLCGQTFGIVKVKDCRGKDYLGEVTKYVVKGSELASWAPEEIAQFVHAIKGIRFFAAFGTLFAVQRQIKAQINGSRPPPEPCKCGCNQFRFEDETRAILAEVAKSLRR
jgi:Replication protein